MRKTCFFLVVLLMAFSALAQDQLGLQWQYSLGGPSGEDGRRLCVEPTGDISILGHTVAGTVGDEDLVLAKFTGHGTLLWKRNLGVPGRRIDRGRFSKTSDNGYIVAGCIRSTPGTSDIWVAKTDEFGNVEWSTFLGGPGDEWVSNIYETADGNYIMLASTTSNSGQVSGNHGDWDAWLVKLDPAGATLWTRCYGGSSYEWCQDIVLTKDNGFVIAGTTASNNGDISGQHGTNNDGFLAKFDGNGNPVWQHCYGGTRDEQFWGVTTDSLGNIYATGLATSNDGDVSGVHGMAEDVWVIKVNSTGSLQWQKSLGGSRSDQAYAIKVARDNSLLVSGYTASNDGDFATNYYKRGFWVARLNKEQAGLAAIFTMGGTGSGDVAYDVAEAKDVGILAVGTSNADNPYISNQHGSTDIWLVKLGAYNTVKGSLFVDLNGNAIHDNNEPLYTEGKISYKGTGFPDSSVILPRGGKFSYLTDTGTYHTSAILSNPWYTVVPATINSAFSSYYNVDSISFAVQPVPNKKDLVVDMFALTPARAGFDIRYLIRYKNQGTVNIPAAGIQLKYDSLFTYKRATQLPTGVNGTTIDWSDLSIPALDSGSIVVTFTLAPPPAASPGDTVRSTVSIEPMADDQTPVNNTDTLVQRVTASFDPNDKTESHGGIITPAEIAGTDPLTYVIRFQNSGTDTAFNIFVRDTLDSRLDWNSLEMIGASHAYQLAITNGNELTWSFNNIRLPHAGINEPASHGYLAYRIKPKPTAVLGDTIKNAAGIYFDFNPPVATNTEKTVVFGSVALPATLVSFDATLNGTVVDIKWKISTELNVSHFEVMRSENGTDFTTIGAVEDGKASYLFTDRNPLTGDNWYKLKVVNLDGSIVYSPVAKINTSQDKTFSVSVYPNPVTGRIVTVKIEGSVQGSIRIQVFDRLGRVLVTKRYPLSNAPFKAEIALNPLSKGSYLIKVMADDRVYWTTLLIQ